MIGQKYDPVDQVSEPVDEEMGRMTYVTKILNGELRIEQMYTESLMENTIDRKTMNLVAVKCRSL